MTQPGKGVTSARLSSAEGKPPTAPVPGPASSVPDVTDPEPVADTDVAEDAV